MPLLRGIVSVRVPRTERLKERIHLTEKGYVMSLRHRSRCPPSLPADILPYYAGPIIMALYGGWQRASLSAEEPV